MTDLDRVISRLKRRSWKKMKASWLERLALVDLNAGAGLEDIPALDRIAAAFSVDRKAAAGNLQRELAAYRQKQIEDRPKKGSSDEMAEASAYARHELTRRAQIYGPLANKREEVPGVRGSLFFEGLRLAGKAFHVLGCAEGDAHKGNRRD